MGYYRNVSDFNDGKKSEFKERVWFTEDKSKKGYKNEEEN